MAEFSGGVTLLQWASEKPQCSPPLSVQEAAERDEKTVCSIATWSVSVGDDCQSCRWYKVVLNFFPRLWQPPASVLRAANLSCILKSCLWCALAVGLFGCIHFCQPCARDFPLPELFGQWEVDLVWISWRLCFYFFLWSIMSFTVSRSA